MTDQSPEPVVVVPRGSLSAIMSYAETSGDLGVIGRRCLNDLKQALAAAPASPDPLLEEAVGLLRDWRAIWFCSADARSERVVARDTDAFLSKVEERGHD